MSFYERINVNLPETEIKSEYPLGLNEDGRRKLTAVFNGDFHAHQVKIVEAKKSCVLGGHSHIYAELFYILKGNCIVKLKYDVLVADIPMVEGDRLIIQGGVFHTFEVSQGTIIIEATSMTYKPESK